MTYVVRTALLLLVALGTSNVWAQAKGEKKAKKGPQKPQAVAQLEKQIEGLTLTDEQSAKVKAILKEYEPKLNEAAQKVAASMTAEQRKARQEATQKAKGEGKKGKELAEAIAASVKLTAEQQKQADAAQQAQRDVAAAMKKAVLEALPADQRAKLETPAKKKKK